MTMLGGIISATDGERKMSAVLAEQPQSRTRRKPHTYQNIVSRIPDKFSSLMEYDREVYAMNQKVSTWLHAVGRIALSKNEFSVLFFIIGRTVQYGKTAELITKSQFLNGVWSEDVALEGPTGLNARDLYEGIKSLESRGAISVHPINFQGKKLPTLYKIEIDFILSTEARRGGK